MSNTSIGTLIRSAALATLLVAPTLSAYANDNAQPAMSGAAQKVAGTQVTNAPDWQSVTYKTLP
jgi:hypothetical protein